MLARILLCALCATLLVDSARIPSRFRRVLKKPPSPLPVPPISWHGVQRKHAVLFPMPRSITTGNATLRFSPKIMERSASRAGRETRDIVRAQLFERLGLDSSFRREAYAKGLPVSFARRLDRPSPANLPMRERDEAYSIVVSKARGVFVDANTTAGLANAMATLYQLIEVRGDHDGRREFVIPNCPISIKRDSPVFPHRGFLLDTARTFYETSAIKDLITQLTEFKINVLHLHLTDTSSWPVEISSHPELAKKLAYTNFDGEPKTYSREEVRDLVEHARLRGMSIIPEVDGPAHAPALASFLSTPLTVDGTVDKSSPTFSVEPPNGIWKIRDVSVLDTLRQVFSQLHEDFSTAPYLHVGGDEPVAASFCAILDDPSACLEECAKPNGAKPEAQCKVTAERPVDAKANTTWWFPDVFNPLIQRYFDGILPRGEDNQSAFPIAMWSGAFSDLGVTPLSSGKGRANALQLWEWDPSNHYEQRKLEEACDAGYDLVQSSATHPAVGDKDKGWMYLECGMGGNWISMADEYWCTRANWVSLYALAIEQTAPSSCKRNFIGAEAAAWGEISSQGNIMSMVFPRITALAERLWTDPPSLGYEQFERAEKGAVPISYWQDTLKDALFRLNRVVNNLQIQDVGVSNLQPQFCLDHPEYCENYTEKLLVSLWK